MPKILLPLQETNESIVRPIVFEVVRQLSAITNVPETTTIYFPGDLEKNKQSGSSFQSQGEDILLPYTNRVKITVDENYEADRMLSTAIMRPENLFVFRDDRIETYVKPAYSSMDVAVNFTYRAIDKQTAERWRDGIRARFSMGRDINLHDFSYHYLIPLEFIQILKEIHRMREAVDGYGDSWDKFFKDSVTQRASILTTQAGTNGAWGVSETQKRIQGWFDFEGAPEKGSKEDEGDTWTIPITYHFRYEKPIGCVMSYPLVVHNQLVGDKYRETEELYDPEDTISNGPLSLSNFRMFEKGVRPSGRRLGLAIPSFDEFIPADVVSGTIRVFTALTLIDPASSLLMSLDDLGDKELDPALIKFIREEAPYLNKVNASVLNISLYSNENLQTPESVEVRTDLSVHAMKPLSLRNYYHVRLGICADFSSLLPDALERVRKHGVALIRILNAIDPELNQRGLLPPFIGSLPTSDGTQGSGGGAGGVMGSGYLDDINIVAKADLLKAIEFVNSAIIAKGDHQLYQFNTVQTLFIQSYTENTEGA